MSPSRPYSSISDLAVEVTELRRLLIYCDADQATATRAELALRLHPEVTVLHPRQDGSQALQLALAEAALRSWVIWAAIADGRDDGEAWILAKAEFEIALGALFIALHREQIN